MINLKRSFKDDFSADPAIKPLKLLNDIVTTNLEEVFLKLISLQYGLNFGKIRAAQEHCIFHG